MFNEEHTILNTTSDQKELVLDGIAASPGIAIGKAFLLGGDVVRIRERTLAEDDISAEISRFQNAVHATSKEIRRLRDEVARDMGDESAKVFDAHQLMLEDELVIDETIRRIKDEKRNADFIFFEVMRRLQSSLSTVNDEYFSARVSDLRDVKRRVIRHIQGDRRDHLSQLRSPAIVVTNDLTPSDTVMIDKEKVLGFATDLGGRTAHAAIMARSLELPSVVGLRQITSNIQSGDKLILDGVQGRVIINPSDTTLKQYLERQKDFDELNKKLAGIKELPARTLDGKDIELAANMEFPTELDSVIAHGAKGVGLYRTEYLYLAKNELPDEQEHYEAYRRVVEGLAPDAVIIRLLDLGGDKISHIINMAPEENPYLGKRAIRILLENPDLLKTQLRAILRASAYGEVKILLPFVSSLNELHEIKWVLEEIKKQLRLNGMRFAEDIEIGVNIEIPSAAVIADLFAKEVDFLSIGTNDLIQYTLAVDRGNEHIAHLYQSFSPSVLRLIRLTVESGHENGVWVGMCGEMAGDPFATLLLIGLELDELSVSPLVLPEIKEIIRSTTYEEAKEVTEKVFAMTTAEEIEKYLKKIMQDKFPFLNN